MSAGDRYATPAAFRRALADRLRVAAGDGRWTLQQLQRQVAYDRLLERLYLIDDGWIVKGATALLARNIGVRGSLDVDLHREAAREVAKTNCGVPPRRTSATGSNSKSAVAERSATTPSGFPSTPSLDRRAGSSSTLTSWGRIFG